MRRHLQRNADEVTREIAPNRKETVITLKKPIPINLSMVIGDVVTNTRAALDYIIWELATKYCTPPLDLTKPSDRRLTSFPIDVGDQGFKDKLKLFRMRQFPTLAVKRT
jgi:hypothetical protein